MILGSHLDMEEAHESPKVYSLRKPHFGFSFGMRRWFDQFGVLMGSGLLTALGLGRLQEKMESGDLILILDREDNFCRDEIEHPKMMAKKLRYLVTPTKVFVINHVHPNPEWLSDKAAVILIDQQKLVLWGAGEGFAAQKIREAQSR